VVLPTARFVDVGPEDGLASGATMRSCIGDIAVAVFNVDGRIYALEDFCFRCGSSLAAGGVSGLVVTCMRCHWQYHVASGSVQGLPSLRLDTFEAKIVDARIMIASTASRVPPGAAGV
jgi:nitrite reductase/ring-hydroxylating ferredoxin subunit